MNIKKIICGILCAALIWLSFGVLSYAQQEPVKFVVLGDSIAAGSGVSDKKDAYAWLVAEEKGYDLSNFGAGGDTSAMMLEKLRSNETFCQVIADADIIAVSIGGNDLLHAEDLASLIVKGLLGDYDPVQPILDEFKENFAGIIAGIRGLNPDAMLIVQTLYNPAFPLPSLRDAYGAAIQGLNAVVHEYLTENPGAYILADVYEAFQGRSGLVFIDMTHPSGAGHAMIAAVLISAIDGAPPQLPPANAALDLLVRLAMPVLKALDWTLVGTVLRVLYAIAAPFLG